MSKEMKIVVTRAPRLNLVNVHTHKKSMKGKVGYWITADGNTVMVNGKRHPHHLVRNVEGKNVLIPTEELNLVEAKL